MREQGHFNLQKTNLVFLLKHAIQHYKYKLQLECLQNYHGW